MQPMADLGSSGTVVSAQLSEVLDLLLRARQLFGDNVSEPPQNLAPDEHAAGQWVR